ncbi:MBL fold metallo-hydrolase [Halochromatium salexigens]|uniref:Metal-dependent hydrolase n=1 Tax=Halochromatium salexigens TaxID=49447 RepID=A0AAJ0XF16_HALSE|nr:MBL fold metallo-hydrolase [Halochromatium salexigens]MBK5929177.1 metal-dependent hydrolase [Halochromatium salexigens]
MTANLRLTILFDNRPSPAGLTALWGFAALIEAGDQTFLFDTGSNGRVLLKNMAALGLSMASVDQLFLSHPHWDHMGGLDSVLEANPALSVVLHGGFSKHLIHDLHGLCREVIVVGAEPQTLAPGLFSTGLLDSQPPEQALILNLGGVTMAITGCAHPGMEQIVERGRALLGQSIRWAIGGFHLMYADDAELARSVQALQALGVTDVLPTHCTGDAATMAFEQAYGDHCLSGGVGRRLAL